MIIKRGKNQVMHNIISHHSLNDDRCPFLNLDQPPFWVAPPVHVLGMMMLCGVEHPFGQSVSSDSAILPLGFVFCLLPNWQSMRGP